MPIDLDVSAAIRHPDLGRVIRAVLDADEHDEADWIEWKSDLNFSTKAGCFPIARTILGMANRMPAAAALACEGLGYIVVGAEPGNLLGVTSVDPAYLDQTLEPWLGGVEGPRYTPTYVLIDGKKILVVVVEAPKSGDPVYTLRKEFDGSRDGDIFVRKSGRTERANSADVKALMGRAVVVGAARPDLEVSLVGDIPLPWFDPATIEESVAAWVRDRRRAMESDAQAEERRRHPEKTQPPNNRIVETMASVMADYASEQERLRRLFRDSTRFTSIAGLANEPDKRTLDEFLVEVASWGERAADAGPDVVLDRYLRAGHGLVAVRVHNPTGRYLPKVRVEVHFEGDRVCAAERRYPAPRPPAEPRPYGTPTPSALAQSLSYSPSFLTSLAPSFDHAPIRRRSWTEEGSVRIVFDVGDLRQEATDMSDEHYLLLTERPPDGMLHGTWKATGPDIDAVIRGTLEVAVREDAFQLRELLDHEPEEDET